MSASLSVSSSANPYHLNKTDEDTTTGDVGNSECTEGHIQTFCLLWHNQSALIRFFKRCVLLFVLLACHLSMVTNATICAKGTFDVNNNTICILQSKTFCVLYIYISLVSLATHGTNCTVGKTKNALKENLHNIGQLELPDGSSTNDNQEKAEILNDYFASVFAEDGTEALPDFEERNFAEPLTNIEINETKIIKTIYKLQASKSQGPDQIHPKLIKECKDSLIKPLEILLKKSMENNRIPKIWKR